MAPQDAEQQVFDYLQGLHRHLVDNLSACDGGSFADSPWRSDLGEGCSSMLEDGELLERAGVAISRIANDSLPPAASSRHPELHGSPYTAMGVSLVLHPRNPFVPTVHLNVRFFLVAAKQAWWFGGGMDLTPSYGFAEDCRHFHATCKRALDAVDEGLYPQFKRQCDEYFHIRHRGQMRGIGGVFFDDYNSGDLGGSFAAIKAVGEAFLPAYLPIVERRCALEYDQRQRAHQLHRRGRYVEFNLVYDRGTLFGLQSGGRADSILMSLPPQAGWDVLARQRDAGDEATLHEQFLQPKDWLADAGKDAAEGG